MRLSGIPSAWVDSVADLNQRLALAILPEFLRTCVEIRVKSGGQPGSPQK
jgi:hypothetical protein